MRERESNDINEMWSDDYNENTIRGLKARERESGECMKAADQVCVCVDETEYV